MFIFKILYKILFFKPAFTSAIFSINKNDGWNIAIDEKELKTELRLKLKNTSPGFNIMSPGYGFMMNLAKSVLYLFYSIQNSGLSREDAYAFTKAVVWEMARDAGTPLSNYLSFIRSPQIRIQFINKILWGIIYTKPFKRSNITTKNGLHSFDVVSCPISEYYKDNREEQLCSEAFCSVDFKLAEQWGITFKRNKTLVRRCDSCDFKFIFNK